MQFEAPLVSDLSCLWGEYFMEKFPNLIGAMAAAIWSPQASGDHTPEVLDMWSKVKGDNLGGGIVIFLLAVVLALTVFVAIKKYEHYKHRRLSRKHRRRHVVKVKR